MDIIIELKGAESWFIVIENKVKSQINRVQLEEYGKVLREKENKGIKVADKVVLSLYRGRESHVGEWKVRTYGEHILSFLNALEIMDFGHSGFEKDVISEYGRFVESLVKLCDDYIERNEKDFGSSRYKFYSPESYTKLKELKLHDLVSKIFHEKIASLVLDELGSNNEEFEVESGFTNTEGLNSIKLNIKNANVKIGIQLQGDVLRQFVESGNPELAIKIARELVKEKLWFWNGEIESLQGNGNKPKEKQHVDALRVYPIGHESDRRFCQFSKRSFLYLYKPVDELKPSKERPTIHELVLIMVEMMREAVPLTKQVLRLSAK